jgi:L-threonylcarbamoyladenylate synthase
MPREVSTADGDGESRQEFERCIAAGGVALFPADTVYGLACDPSDDQAVARLQRLKGREDGRPAAVMFFTLDALHQALPRLGPRTAAAVGELLPGPVTLILPNAERKFPLACGPDPSRIGVRLISGPLEGAKCAVMQSSANPTGGTDPKSVDEVDDAIRGGADLVVDGGRLPGKPSTVIDLHDFEQSGHWAVLRRGPLKRSEIRKRMEAAAA